MIDLHVHTTASDGTLTPAEVIAHAAEVGLTALAITDHDTVDGLKEAVSAVSADGPELIPGMEMSCVFNDVELHILGFYVDCQCRPLLNDLKYFQDARDKRNLQIINNLNKAGIPVTLEDLFFGNPDTMIGRGHFARYLIENNYVADKHEAFAKYLQENGPFVPRKTTTSDDILRFMKKYNIVSALAHPMQYDLTPVQLDKAIAALAGLGLDAIEVWHPSTRVGNDNMLQKIASKYGLICTGGSDFHGSNKPGLELGTGYGNLYVDDSVLTDLKKCHESKL